jgi:hypothetical protein
MPRSAAFRVAGDRRANILTDARREENLFRAKKKSDLRCWLVSVVWMDDDAESDAVYDVVISLQTAAANADA